MNVIEEDGTDMDWSDQDILRFIIAREYRFDDIIKDMRSHLEWRQTNRPMPILNEQSLQLLKRGALYVHGRCKDLGPLLICNMGVVGQMMEEGNMCCESFCNLHNFLAGYMQKNMLVPGQVDRWITIVDAS